MFKFFREPLFQFLVLGGILFLLNSLNDNDEGQYISSSNKVEISQQDIERFIYIWQKTHFRNPTKKELNHLIESRIKEEILYREALLLELDKDDSLIRARLAQKLSFLSEGFVEQGIPTDNEVEAYYQAHQILFLSNNKISFKQVFVNLQNDKWTHENISVLLEKLNSQTVDVSKAGDASLLQQEYYNKDQESIGNLFGEAFAEQIMHSKINQWLGPIFSSYGGHLVTVLEKQPASQLPLEQVSVQIKQLILEQRAKESEQMFYDNLRLNYQVTVASFDLTRYQTQTK